MAKVPLVIPAFLRGAERPKESSSELMANGLEHGACRCSVRNKTVREPSFV
jgi:hypothetical protein